MGSRGVVERMDVRPGHLYYQEHVARYELARQHVKPGALLDIASGSGYGTDLLQPVSQALVVGIDIDQPALSAARNAYPSPRIVFLAASGTAIPFRDASFANITSMETLEHIRDDKEFLGELARVLQPGGVCIMSTPNRLYSLSHGITNPFHVREYSEAEFTALLSTFFEAVQVLQQGFGAGYHANVRQYAEAIQTQKRSLHPVLRWSINHVYRPLKRVIPVSMANDSIRRLLGLSYPQPDRNDITISAQPVEECSNFVAVCRKSNT